MKELTTQTGIIVKCRKTAIEFFQNAQSADFFAVLEIPEEFQGIAVEFYDLIMKKASVISGKRLWTPLWKSFWIRTIPGTTVPWDGFDQAKKEASLWDLTSTPEH